MILDRSVLIVVSRMPSSGKSSCKCISQKWIFTILASAALCIQYLFAVIMSITIIEMVVPIDNPELVDSSCPSADNATFRNQTFVAPRAEVNESIKRYSWDEYTQGIILSSLFWSNSATHFIAGPLAERFGGKYLLGVGTLIQAVLAIFTPFIIDWGGSTALIITRVLTGIVVGGMYPISSTMISKWTTPSDKTMIGNAIYAGTVLGLFFGTIAPALIMKYSGMGWPAVFYFMGIVGIIWFPFWQIFVYDSPEKHPFISKEELDEFRRRPDVEKANRKLPPTPWKEILSCKEFWAFTIILSGSNWAFFAMLSGLPKYMGNVVKFPLESNGYFSSLPYLFTWLNTILSAWISDKILEKQWLSLTNVRKLLTTVSVMGPGIFLLLASYAGCDKTLVVIMFMIGITLTGTVYSSFFMNPLDLSPNYAGSIMSVGSGIASCVGFLAPYLVGLLAPNSTLSEWRIVFWIVFLSGAVSNLVYLVWFKAEIKPWNDPKFVMNQTKFTKVKQEIDEETIS